MMTLSNLAYASLKRKGLHNWGFLQIKQSDFDYNDMDYFGLEPMDSDWFLLEPDELGGKPS